MTTLDNFYVTSLKDNCIDEKEYHRFVTQFENYQATANAAANAASQEIHTKSRVASRELSHTASHTKSQVASHTPPTIPLKPHNFL